MGAVTKCAKLRVDDNHLISETSRQTPDKHDTSVCFELHVLTQEFVFEIVHINYHKLYLDTEDGFSDDITATTLRFSLRSIQTCGQFIMDTKYELLDT